MTEDGLFPTPYSAFIRKLNELGVHEEDSEAAASATALGCRVLTREMMGFGCPTVLLRVKSDDDLIQPVEIEHVLRIFGFTAGAYRAA